MTAKGGPVSATDAVILDLLRKGVPMETIRAGIRMAAAKLAKEIAEGKHGGGHDS